MSRQQFNPNRAYPTTTCPRTSVGLLMSEAAARIKQILDRNPDAASAFVLKLSRIVTVCVYPYLLEIAVCIMAGDKVPGPKLIAKKYGITRQAISKAILDCLKKLREIDRPLAWAMKKYAEGAIKDDTDEPDPVDDEPALPPIDTKGLGHISDPDMLIDRMEALALRIIEKHVEDSMQEQASMVRSALTAYGMNFLRHLQEPSDEMKRLRAIPTRARTELEKWQLAEMEKYHGNRIAAFSAWKVAYGRCAKLDSHITSRIDALIYNGEDEDMRHFKYGMPDDGESLDEVSHELEDVS